MKKLFNFGLYMLGSKIFHYFSQNLAAIIIGKFIGAETLGAFNIAYNLAIVPAQKIQSILTTVLTPTFSQLQNNISNLRKTFFISLFTLGIIFIPLMLGLAAISNNFVLIVYGEQWQQAGIFLSFLAFVGLLKGIEHLLLSIILATGGASTGFRITIIETFASFPLLILGIYLFNVIGLIIAYIIASLISFILTVIAAQNTVGDKKLFITATTRTFIIAILMFAITFSYPLLLSNIQHTIFIQIILGGMIYIVLRIKFLTPKELILVKNMPLGNMIWSK
jgi:O-antigen/teichoic acid export membrane protein